MNGASAPSPLYVAARKVLLDALCALKAHGSAVILCGAQAVYLRSGDADLAIAPYTTDGDLALDPSLLRDLPLLEVAMREANFTLRTGDRYQPGIWVAPAEVDGATEWIPVDLIVPEGVAVKLGRRGARLGVHGNQAARRAVGLEAALFDNSSIIISALDPSDTRSVEARVAGTAALFVAKAHKLRDRVSEGRAGRIADKDAGDVVRLIQATVAMEVAATIRRLGDNPIAGPVTRSALDYLEELFGHRGAQGIQMASRALFPALTEETMEVICAAYIGQLRVAQ
jgi:hypothetical protein